MATYYVDSTAAGTNTGADWTNAFTSCSSLSLANGDTVYVASTHAGGDFAVTTTLCSVGTVSSPVKFICADKTSGTPPTTVATGGIIEVTGASHTLTINAANTWVQFYGITFRTGASQSTSCTISCNQNNYFDNCRFEYLSTQATSGITIGIQNTAKDCQFKFGATTQVFNLGVGARLIGGGIASGSSAITTGIGLAGGNTVYDFDYSGAGSAAPLFVVSGAGQNVVAAKIKTPAAWTGVPLAATNQDVVVEASNYGNTGTNTSYYRRTAYGSVENETTLVMTGGASDGTTTVSRKMVTSSNAGTFPSGALRTAEFAVWNDTVGSSMTKSIEFLHDSLTGLKDNEFWITVRYPADTGDPLGGLATSAPSWLAAGSTLTSSGATWTTTGMTNPNKQKATTASFTPQLKGYIYYTIHLAKASYTVYFNPPQT